MNVVVADQRILQGNSATLSVTMTNQDGTPTDAAGAVTVGVTTADGTVVLAAGTATTHGFNGSGAYTVALPANKTTALNLLTATWTDAGDGSVTVTLIEIVGGYYFSIAEARASDTTLTDTSKYSNQAILDARAEVEWECEWICDVAFVPRYRRVSLDGDSTNQLVLPDNHIRRIRTIRQYTDLSAGANTALTADQLADVYVGPDNRIDRTDFAYFNEGRGNIVVEYEHGYDRPPADLKRAALHRLRHRLNFARSGIPDRASRFQEANGVSYNLNPITAYKTGIDEVDAVYGRYSLRSQGGGDMMPASRRMDFDSQWGSLFHGRHR